MLSVFACLLVLLSHIPGTPLAILDSLACNLVLYHPVAVTGTCHIL